MLPDPATLSKEDLLDELALYLRPPGQGVYAVSTGREALAARTRAYLGEDTAVDPWRAQIARAADPSVRVALLALPSDTGAGIVRGASRGPEAIREQLGSAPVLDLGDVFTVPQLLHDEMCSEGQLGRSRAALYREIDHHDRRNLPVSPMSMCERTYALLGALNPGLKVMLLGGDHTVSWPAMAHLLRHGPEANADVGIVHFDAHTDLLPERLGVRYCFATWAYHANRLLGGGKRMVQIGIRASGHERAHWESTQDVRQIWAKEALEMSPEALRDDVIAHLEDLGVKRVYVSNDLDGTDEQWASACGTPEPGGLTREHVDEVIEGLIGRFEPLGADMVELAPVLSLDREKARISAETAARYTRTSLRFLKAHAGE